MSAPAAAGGRTGNLRRDVWKAEGSCSGCPGTFPISRMLARRHHARQSVSVCRRAFRLLRWLALLKVSEAGGSNPDNLAPIPMLPSNEPTIVRILPNGEPG